MTKQLDITIVEAIKSIIAEADCEVNYSTHKTVENAAFKKNKREVIKVDITLSRAL